MAGLDFFKGLARGGLADLVGSPVGGAQAAPNLGIIGVGLAGHKLGFLPPGQMPMPLEGSVGSSDWFAKGTLLADIGAGDAELAKWAQPKIPSNP